MPELPALPCYPCPHLSACCAYGVTLSDAEAAAITREHGAGTVYRTRWGEWRTRVRGGRCVFLRENVCTIHSRPYYPAVGQRPVQQPDDQIRHSGGRVARYGGLDFGCCPGFGADERQCEYETGHTDGGPDGKQSRGSTPCRPPDSGRL